MNNPAPNLYSELKKIPSHIAFGSVRLKVIRNFFLRYPNARVPVDCANCELLETAIRGIQTKSDRAVRRLIQEGFLTTKRDPSFHNLKFLVHK